MYLRKKHFISPGTFPEEIPGSNKLYNTCQIYNPRGELMAHFRKVNHVISMS